MICFGFLFYKHFCFLNFTLTPQNVLFAIGSAFLYYVNHFKLYSSFCASHSKAQKVLHPSKTLLLDHIFMSQAHSNALLFITFNLQMKAIRHCRSSWPLEIPSSSTAAPSSRS